MGSHLAALRDADVLRRLLAHRARILDLAHDIHAVDDLAKDDVLAVEKRRRHGGDEELTTVCVWAGVLRYAWKVSAAVEAPQTQIGSD